MKFITCDKYDWQYPAITEKYAYDCLLIDDKVKAYDVIYIAYPWATIIDFYHKESASYRDLTEFCERCFDIYLDRNAVILTVCQTYHYRKFLPYFAKLGVRYVFAPHATRYDYYSNIENYGIEILPFPLYAVHATPPADNKDVLFSFIGNTKYKGKDEENSKRAEDLRSRLMVECSGLPNVIVQSNEQWHFQKEVYKKQIYGQQLTELEVLEQQEKENAYKEILSRSIFSLCPRGVGPSSIRFWESLAAGAIPINMADDLWLPEDIIDWTESIIDISEDNIASVKERIELTTKEEIERFKYNAIQAYAAFSGQNFISPILKKLEPSEKKSGNQFALFIPFYLEKNERRREEYLQCLLNNLHCKFISEIYVLYEYCSQDENFHREALPSLFLDQKVHIRFAFRKEPRQLSYLDFIQYANEVLIENQKFIISNSDIFFDESLGVLNNLSVSSRVYALTRYNIKPYHTFQGHVWRRNSASQDAWISEAPMREVPDYNINLGWIGCDNCIAYAFYKQGYEVLNISESIKSWHIHDDTNQQQLYDSSRSYKYSGKPYKFLPLLHKHHLLHPRYVEQKVTDEDRRVYEWHIKSYARELREMSIKTGLTIGVDEYSKRDIEKNIFIKWKEECVKIGYAILQKLTLRS